MRRNCYDRDRTANEFSARHIGMSLAGLFIVVALVPIAQSGIGALRWWAATVATAFAACALFWPTPVNLLHWISLPLLRFLGRFSTEVVISLVFLLAFLPVALLMRMLGKDQLRLRRDPLLASYWIMRQAGDLFSDKMKNQF
jgi:hypothetical protein